MKHVRPPLLIALAFTAACALVVLGFTGFLSYLRGLDEEISRGAVRLADAERMREEVREMEEKLAATDTRGARGGSRAYAAGEMDPYRFGEAVRDLASSVGLRVERFQPLGSSGGDLVELTMRGTAAAVASFIYAAAEKEHVWRIPHLSMQGDREAMVAVMRMGYETAAADSP